jgi:1-deoxy-D-xylulose-5-phosphate synthase
MSLLETIQSPADLKALPLEQLGVLAAELRDFMISSVAETGGHLASSLGAVELTLALHCVMNLPHDKLVWDVGHQTYTHKILTGRRNRFHTLRQYEGISGFPKREESPYDAFNTGHSSTSISAALGMARARDLSQKPHRVVAVIGDGSLSNGLALEALNDAGHKKTDLLVVLNDNRMSISKPVGGLSNYLNQIITGQTYNRLKQRAEGLLGALPAVGRSALKITNYLEEIAKGLLVPGVLFEELGFRYLGPVDGHDLALLIPTLERVRMLSGPILLHVLTTKGKGFEYAEKNPETFHGIPEFDTRTGKAKHVTSCISYSKAFSKSLLALARQDPKVVAIVAAMTSGTALDDFAAELPERFFDVGIAEGHAVTLAAGLAAEGFHPAVVIYSTFLQRAYDNILHDVCLQNLPVIFALDRAGLVGEDGPTHHGVFDLAYLRHIPNLTILAPSDENELVRLLKAAMAWKGPVAIRYPRGHAQTRDVNLDLAPAAWGQARTVRRGKDVVILALGNMLAPALKAAEALSAKGVEATVVDPRFVKPLDRGRSKIMSWPAVSAVRCWNSCRWKACSRCA